jgi:ABC-type glycerol-3-phosphate transport system permease component
MSLVSKVGRKRPRARIAMTVLYAILCLGAITTVYPFLLMISTGLKGPTDQNDTTLIPTFLSNPAELSTKFLDDKYAGDASMIASTRIGENATVEEVNKYNEWLMSLPTNAWTAGFRLAPNQVTSKLSQRYQAWLRTKFGDIDTLNQAYLEENVAFQTVQPPSELLDRATWKPTSGKKYDEWLIFKATLPAEFRIPLRQDRFWQEYVRKTYQNRISDVPAALNPDKKDTFEGLVTPTPTPDEFKAFLPVAFKSLPAANSFPIAAAETAFVRQNQSDLKGEFAGRNFRYVIDYVLIHGRAVFNTILFCSLAILTQLIVNPIAAYALSRYPIKASGQILIFLLATMAFPAEVAMIPSFLLLKDLGLLNTFAALILPGAASGYMIFLLKGFFDSLPAELYEAGQIDGAKEQVMLFKIALPLSKPVLGYLALMAFMASYSTFMFAFLVAQDQKMWTLMVWVYQLQTTAPKAVVMAALALVALPTLLVFLAAQRVIMRGIVLPGER